MPFDCLPENVVSDLVKLRVALSGVQTGWASGYFGARGGDDHCAIGWLLVAAEWDTTEATRLALEYVYPALPETRRNPERRLQSIWEYNDTGGQKRIVTLFEKAAALAEQQPA